MDRQYGFLKEIMVAPVSRPSIVFGKALGIGLSLIHISKSARWIATDALRELKSEKVQKRLNTREKT